MRSVTTALSNYIASDAKVIYGADLHTITLVDKTVIRWTDADRAWTYGGNTWTTGPLIGRDKVSFKAGLETDTLGLWITPQPTDLVGGTAVRTRVVRGDFDGAAYRLDRLYATADGAFTLLDVVPRFVGRLGAATVDGAKVQFKARSQLYLLDAKFPRNVYQPGCRNMLFDAACGLKQSLWQSSGSVASVTSQRVLVATGTPTSAFGQFILGRFKFTSGANAGREMQVVDHQPGQIFTFARAWPATVAVGDTFTVSYGCDRRLTTCRAIFNNDARFRGEPFIPAAETIL